MIELEGKKDKEFIRYLESNLRRIQAIYKLYRHFQHAVMIRLKADAVCLYHGGLGDEALTNVMVVGDETLIERRLLDDFAHCRRPALPHTILLAPIRVHSRVVGVVGAARRQTEFTGGSGYIMNQLCAVLAEEITRRVEERHKKVLDQIKEKVISELRPLDLAYQILAGLHELLSFDHSAALLTYMAKTKVLRVEAEKIVWTKSKSAFIGHEFPVKPELLNQFQNHQETLILDCCPHVPTPENQWEIELYKILDYSSGTTIPAPTSILCAPLFFESEFLGILKVAVWQESPFDAWDVRVVNGFRKVAATSIRNARLKMLLEDRAVQAEVRASLITLAQAVSHDVRNAAGGILLLAQQLREELNLGIGDQEVMVGDLDQIIEKSKLIKRIFMNLLKDSQATRAGLGPVDVNRSIREVLLYFEGQLDRNRIRLVYQLDEAIPAIKGSRRHLEQIVIGLLANSIDAMNGQGGAITVATEHCTEDRVILSLTDTGPGMSHEGILQAMEPFFTTKPGGTGLGLPICRALAWQIGGRLELTSEPGQGVTATLSLEVYR